MYIFIYFTDLSFKQTTSHRKVKHITFSMQAADTLGERTQMCTEVA